MSSEFATSPVVPADATSFRQACARFATGVTVATVLDGDGQPHGMTANAFASVSLDPLLFLVCIDKKSSVLSSVSLGRPFAVNILSEEQRHFSTRFSRPGEDRFGKVEWIPGSTGAPLIPHTLASIEGVIREMIPAGDHIIVLTEALFTRYKAGRPLLYFHSSYQQIGEPSL